MYIYVCNVTFVDLLSDHPNFFRWLHFLWPRSHAMEIPIVRYLRNERERERLRCGARWTSASCPWTPFSLPSSLPICLMPSAFPFVVATCACFPFQFLVATHPGTPMADPTPHHNWHTLHFLIFIRYPLLFVALSPKVDNIL